MKTLFNALFALSIIAGIAATTVSSSQAFDGEELLRQSKNGRATEHA